MVYHLKTVQKRRVFEWFWPKWLPLSLTIRKPDIYVRYSNGGTGHPNVRFSNVSGFRMFGIRIPTVLKLLNYVTVIFPRRQKVLPSTTLIGFVTL